MTVSDLDETDFEILRLLQEDGRRPYSDIAEAVGLSAPAVSARVEKLQELGIIRQFTVDVDRSQLGGGVPVLVRVSVTGDGATRDQVREALTGSDPVEHVFVTADGDVVFSARLPDSDVAGWLDTHVVRDETVLENYEVTLLAGSEWSPDLSGAAFAVTCAECGNTVDSEGVAARIGDERYQFCCPSCESRFRDRYEQVAEGAE
jgi:DNA-binding Lrp family transcriptional regulator